MYKRLYTFLSFLFIALATMATTPCLASKKPNFDAFGTWPILHDGRIKTMESFARSIFYKIAKSDTVDNITAIEWLAHSLFDPSSTISHPFIHINRPDILNFKNSKQKYYSMNDAMAALQPYQDILPALEQRNSAELTSTQKELLTLYQTVSLYNQVILGFSLVLPLNNDDRNFIDGGGSATQRDLIREGGQDNNLIKIIPHDNPSTPLISPWQSFNNKMNMEIITHLKTMAFAWNTNDYQTWNTNAITVQNMVNQSDIKPSWTLALEHHYTTIQPMLWGVGFYVMSAFLLLIALKTNHPISITSGKVMALCGLTIHIGALIVRSLILARPPTGTLYETLLFGAGIIAFIGILMGFKGPKNISFMVVCIISSVFLLYISRGFIQGDSLNVLVAVLNTNFWLSTHVTCIIIGYGFCVMAAMIGHVVLWNDRSPIEKLMIPMTITALLFTAVGTLLGGIWADQSWGRFWGWDPKENGALLIVLWLIWALHGRLSGHLNRARFAAMISFTNIMVALTWFGVNLLGVGLHSYGFINDIAWGLGSFVTIEILLVSSLLYRHKKVFS